MSRIAAAAPDTNGGSTPASRAPEDAARERLVFALRRLEGIDLVEFEAATGYSAKALGGDALQRFLDRGLLDQSRGRLRLTRPGAPARQIR